MFLYDKISAVMGRAEQGISKRKTGLFLVVSDETPAGPGQKRGCVIS